MCAASFVFFVVSPAKSKLPRRTARAILGVALAATAACSSGGGGGVALGPDAGVSGSGDDAGATPSARAVGVILLAWSDQQVAGTAFFSSPTASGTDPCERTVVGDCEIVSCPAAEAPDAQLASAGTLTFTGGSDPVVMKPSELLSGQYAIVSGDDASFADGAMVAVSASGDGVPAFSDRSVPVPEAIVVSGDRPAIDFSKSFPVAWNDGGPHGKVVVEIITDGGERNGHLTCSFDPAAHRATIPADALAKLPGCPPDHDCVWQVQPESTVHFTAGDYAIDFMVVGSGATGMFQQLQ